VRTTNQKIIAVVLFVFSLIYFSSGFKYKIGTHKVMGPGFFPLLIGVLLLVCTGIHLLRVMKTKGREDGEAETSAGEGVNYRAIVGITPLFWSTRNSFLPPSPRGSPCSFFSSPKA